VIETRFAAARWCPFKELTKPLKIANNVVAAVQRRAVPDVVVSSLYLQQVLGLSPLDTGLIFLPMALTIMLVPRAPGGSSTTSACAGARQRPRR
jgi:hypothetical protein